MTTPGLNHLGWVRRVRLRGEDITGRLLNDPGLLRGLYSAALFDPALIQTLRLIPTEYLFFYYSQRTAYRNQLKAGATRGEELARMNTHLFEHLAAMSDAEALEAYRAYLQQRNASYMKLEGQAGSAFTRVESEPDPFDARHGIPPDRARRDARLDVRRPREIVLNVLNRGAIDDLDSGDIVEVPCDVDRTGARPRRIGHLPEQVRGLTLSVKAYERTAIRASLEGSRKLAQLALLEYPPIAQWEIAGEVLTSLMAADPEGLCHLK